MNDPNMQNMMYQMMMNYMNMMNTNNMNTMPMNPPMGNTMPMTAPMNNMTNPNPIPSMNQPMMTPPTTTAQPPKEEEKFDAFKDIYNFSQTQLKTAPKKENTINEKLPNNFQKAEFLLEKGFIDAIVDRRELRKYIYKILSMHEVKK